MNCQKCSYELFKSFLFCYECGTKITKESVDDKLKARNTSNWSKLKCSECGTVLYNDAKFCHNCGKDAKEGAYYIDSNGKVYHLKNNSATNAIKSKKIEEDSIGIYFKPFSKFGIFSGRASQKEFWTFLLANIIISYFIGLMHSFTISLFWSLLIIIPTISVTIRRLHDANHSGWWFLINFIPIIGWLVLIALLLISSSSNGENKYGELNDEIPETEILSKKISENDLKRIVDKKMLDLGLNKTKDWQKYYELREEIKNNKA